VATSCGRASRKEGGRHEGIPDEKKKRYGEEGVNPLAVYKGEGERGLLFVSEIFSKRREEKMGGTPVRIFNEEELVSVPCAK